MYNSFSERGWCSRDYLSSELCISLMSTLDKSVNEELPMLRFFTGSSVTSCPEESCGSRHTLHLRDVRRAASQVPTKHGQVS